MKEKTLRHEFEIWRVYRSGVHGVDRPTISKLGLCFRLKIKFNRSRLDVRHSALDRVLPEDGESPEIGTSSIDSVQLNRFYVKTETESSLRNVVF
jgi:hypothetical protein